MFEFLEELEIEWGRVGLASVFWLVVMFGLWIVPNSTGWTPFPMGQRILMSVVSPILIYIVLTMMVNRE